MLERLKSPKAWLAGLVGAAITGAANAATAIVVAPETFNIHEGLEKLGAMALTGAIIGGLAYLKQSPLPSTWDGAERRSKDNGTD